MSTQNAPPLSQAAAAAPTGGHHPAPPAVSKRMGLEEAGFAAVVSELELEHEGRC